MYYICCALACLVIYDMMRLLYVSSSHGRGMDFALRYVNPSVQVLGIWKSGARIQHMSDLIGQEMGNILRFGPEFIIIHLGHNDLTIHPKKKTPARKVKDVVLDLQTLGIAMNIMIPTAKVIYSCPYPRVMAKDFSLKQAKGYNGEANRTLQRLGSKKRGLTIIFVKPLWLSRKKKLGNPLRFMSKDGIIMLRYHNHTNKYKY